MGKRADKKLKQLFCGYFNFNRQVFCEYAYAYTKEQCKIVMARRIARKQGVLPVIVLGWIRDHPNSYEIKLEMEFKEIDEPMVEIRQG